MITQHELKILETLPKPPKNMHLCTDEQVREWLDSCADVSSEGLRTAFQAHLWPGSLEQRLRVWGHYSDLEREAQMREKTRDQENVRKITDKLRGAEERKLKRIGWGR
jgi:hypothetical protein